MKRTCTIELSIALFFTLLLSCVLSKSVHAWDHTVIMFPPPGASFTVPLVPDARNCVYVTDCTEHISSSDGLPTSTPVEVPVIVNEIPTPRDTAGWSFGVPIDRTTWTVEVDNVEDSDSTKLARYAKEHAIDDDVTTIWHTRWVEPAVPMPHWIKIDMQTEHWVDGMVITPRPHHGADCAYCETSNVQDYKVWVSADNNVWGQVAEGSLTFVDGQPQTIDFLIPNKVRYVRLDILSASGDTPAVTLGDIQITESLRDIEITGGAVN